MILGLIFPIILLSGQFSLVLATLSENVDHPSHLIDCDGVDIQEISIEPDIIDDSILSCTNLQYITYDLDMENQGPCDFKSSKRRKHHGWNTLMVNRAFRAEWNDLFGKLESTLKLQYDPSDSQHEPIDNPHVSLIKGIENDDPVQVELAIAQGAKFLSRDNNPLAKTAQYYPIEYAVVLNKLKALKSMLDYMESADSDLKSVLMAGLLIKAVHAGHVTAVRYIVEKYSAGYLFDSCLVQQAIMHKSPVEILYFLIKTFHKEPEITSPHGKHLDSPLHLAVRYSNVDAFAFIFNHGTFSSITPNGDGHLPIHLPLVLCRSAFLLELFTKYPILRTSWTDEQGNNLLHLAVYQNRFEFIKELLEVLRFPVDSFNNEKQTPLLFALYSEYRDIALYLLEKGANLLQTDNHGICPLLVIAKTFSYAYFRNIIESLNDQQVLVAELENMTQTLIIESRWDRIEALFQVFPNLKNNKSFTIRKVQLYCLRFSSRLLKLPIFLEYLLDIQQIDPRSLIHETAVAGNLLIMKLLLSYKAPLLHYDKNNEIPANAAFRNDQFEMVQFLIQNGGCSIHAFTSPEFFLFVLCNGASFVPNSPALVHFSGKVLVFSQFLTFFQDITKTGLVDYKKLTAMCLQFEVFIYYHCNRQIVNSLAAIESVEKAKLSIAQMIDCYIKKAKFPLIFSLLISHSTKNAAFLNNFKNNFTSHSIQAHELINYIEPNNVNILKDYASIC